jgi:hypothetical protein
VFDGYFTPVRTFSAGFFVVVTGLTLRMMKDHLKYKLTRLLGSQVCVLSICARLNSG